MIAFILLPRADDLRSQLQTMGELLRTCQLAMKKVVNDHEELIIKHEVLRVSSYL